MVELDAVEIGQSLVPVIRVLLHHPNFIFDPPYRTEWASPRIDDDLPQIVVVVFEGLLADDDIPTAGERPHHKADWAGFRQFELDRVLVPRIDLTDRGEQDAARNADA